MQKRSIDCHPPLHSLRNFPDFHTSPRFTPVDPLCRSGSCVAAVIDCSMIIAKWKVPSDCAQRWLILHSAISNSHSSFLRSPGRHLTSWFDANTWRWLVPRPACRYLHITRSLVAARPRSAARQASPTVGPFCRKGLSPSGEYRSGAGVSPCKNYCKLSIEKCKVITQTTTLILHFSISNNQ